MPKDAPKDDKLHPFDNPLNGKLVTAVDAILITENDFQTLQNLRYTNTGIKGISGMTRIAAIGVIIPVPG